MRIVIINYFLNLLVQNGMPAGLLRSRINPGKRGLASWGISLRSAEFCDRMS